MKMFLGQFLICNCLFFQHFPLCVCRARKALPVERDMYCIFLKLRFEKEMENGHAFKNIYIYHYIHTFYQYYFVDLTETEMVEKRRCHQSNYKLYYSQSIWVDG